MNFTTKHHRKRLTEEQAIEIYRIKVRNESVSCARRIKAGEVSMAYGVSKKTVRDIWSGRTWSSETRLASATQDDVLDKTSLWGNQETQVNKRMEAKYYEGNNMPRNLESDLQFLEKNPTSDYFPFSVFNNDFAIKLQSHESVVNSVLSFNDPFHSDWPFWRNQDVSQVDCRNEICDGK